MKGDQDISLDVEWTKPLQTYGELKGYKLRYGIKNQPLIEVPIKHSTHQYRLDNLGTRPRLFYSFVDGDKNDGTIRRMFYSETFEVWEVFSPSVQLYLCVLRRLRIRTLQNTKFEFLARVRMKMEV